MISIKEYLINHPIKLVHSGYKEINLDLPSGTLWANKNVGAKNIEDYGDYFSWGETSPKKLYYQDTYTASKKYKKRNSILTPEDDAAHINMRSNWKMPTAEQCQELLTNTDTKEIEINGVLGRAFYSKKNKSKYIFFPYAGLKDEINITKNNFKFADIWTSTSSNMEYAIRMDLDTDDRCSDAERTSSKYLGFSIRGVK